MESNCSSYMIIFGRIENIVKSRINASFTSILILLIFLKTYFYG